jgi:DNA-binding transcriptional regulator YiaG
MTAEQFKQAQEALGLNNLEMADLLCCSLRLVEKMRQGERAVSSRSEKMIKREVQKIAKK